MVMWKSQSQKAYCQEGKGGSLACWCPRYLANFFLWDSSQEGKELHVFSPSQELCDGIELGAIAHVLMYFVDV